MFGGKNKAVTFSYDDGVTQDIRLIEIFDKYNIKATCNINSGLLGQPGSLLREGKTVNHTKVSPGDVREIYKNHEVAAHTLTHPLLTELDEKEIIHQVEDDRLRLEELTGKPVVGMAYPGGGVNFDMRVAGIIKEHTNIKYARTTVSSHSFDLQEDLYCFLPTIYHHREWDSMFETAERFLNCKADKPQLLYVWGHSYEFDINDSWQKFEEFCKMISGKEDIFYATNAQVFGLGR